jgi:hypothetical protein
VCDRTGATSVGVALIDVPCRSPGGCLSCQRYFGNLAHARGAALVALREGQQPPLGQRGCSAGLQAAAQRLVLRAPSTNQARDCRISINSAVC